MKKILLFAFLLCSFSAFAQYPAQPTTKQELGRQTTGDGLIYRGSGAPAYTPVNNRNAWIYYDTTNNRLYKSRLGSWSLMIQDTSAFNEIQMPYIVDDTLYLTQNVTGEPLTAYVNRVWPIAALSDTASITGENQGDVAFVTGGTAVAFRGSAYWNPFSGGGGGGTFNSFNIAGDTGSDIVTDGQTVTVAGGYGINTAETGGTVTVTADTTQIATQSDISGLPSGTGTNQRIVVWTGTNSQGNSTQLQSAAGVALDANLAYRITGGTTASRPTGAAGMMYWNTSNGWFDFHNGTAWFNPLRSATNTGLLGTNYVGYGTVSGLDGSANFVYDAGKVGIGTSSPGQELELYSAGNTGMRIGSSLSVSNFTGVGFSPNVTTNTIATISKLSSSWGGLVFNAFTANSTAAQALNFRAYQGSTAPLAPAITFSASKWSGTTANVALSTTEIIAQFQNATSARVTILGNGATGIGTTTPASLLDVEGGASIGATYSGTTAAPTNGAIVEGSVGIGTNAPSLKLDVRSASANTTGVFSIANTTVTTPLKQFATNATPESAITGSPGDIAFSNAGFAYLKETGSATNTGWAKISTATDLAAVAASVAAIPTPVFGKFTGTTDGFGLITITLSGTPATGACTCTNNANTSASWRYTFSARHSSGTSVDVRVYDADAGTMLVSGAVDFSIICY